MRYNIHYGQIRPVGKGGRALFNMDMGELLLVLLVAFLVVGPKDLPKVAVWVARQLKKLKKMVNDIKTETGWDEFTKDLKDVKTDVEKTVKDADVTREVQEVSEALKQEADDLQRDVQKAAEDVDAAL